VRWGTPLSGTLDAGDAVVEDGSPYDAWTFTAAAGQRVTISLRSEDFDAYLAVGMMDGERFLELSSNDDAADDRGTDARIVMVAPEAGVYTIRANCLPGETGSYVLTVERGR
jgi:hypothetical protein